MITEAMGEDKKERLFMVRGKHEDVNRNNVHVGIRVAFKHDR